MTFPKLNYHHKIITVSSTILAISALLLSSIISWLLYTAVFDVEAKRLVEIAHNQAQLMEAVARFDAQHSAQDVEGGAAAATLSQIAEAHKHYQGFGKTGEVALAWREGDQIAFILSRRNFDLDKPTLVPWHSPLAEPMRLALQGESGTIIGLDYRGQSVLAASRPISQLNLGIVAKIDMAEFRAPFIYTGGVAIGITLLIILVGVFAFQRLVNPIIIRMEESEERFRTLFEGSLDALFLIDPKTHQVLDANPTASQLLLKSRQEIVGSHESQLYSYSANISDPPTDHSFNNQEKDNICAHIETVALRSDGSAIPVEVITHIIKIHGQPVIQSVFRDITERKQAEGQLRLSEQWFRKLFEEGPIGMFIANLDTRFIKVNTAFCQMLGYSESELVGTSIADITYAEDIAKSIEPIKQQLDGELSSYQLEKRYVTKNGQSVWGHLTISFFQDEHATPLYLLGKIENITARKQAEVALQKSEARYRSIVNTLSEIGEGLVIIDENYSVQYMNQVMIDWFGSQPHKICYASIAGLEQPCSYCQLEQVLANGDTIHYQPTMPDGRVFEVVATPFPNANGTFSKMEVLRDITAQKQAHEALIQSQQRYKNLVNSIDGIVWEADAKTFQFTFISQQAERFFGYPLQDWLNQPSFWAEHIHPDDKTWVPTYCAESTANKRDHDFEYRMITADQRTLWIRNLVTVFVENDQAVKLCGIMLDVTDKKATEEKVAIFQRFMETSGEGMGMATLDGKVVYMNPSLCRFVDEPDLKTVLGREFTCLYPETQQKRFQAEVMPKLLQTGQWAGEMKIISSNGKITQTYESFFLIKDNEDQPLYLAAVISNITDIKRTQEALKKANLALTALTECRQVLFHAQDEQTMLQEICQVLVQKIGYRLVWVGFAEADANQTVRPVAQYGYEDGYLDNLSISWGDNELGQGPTGTAIRTGQPSIAQHIQTDPKYAPWHSQAQQRGYASSMAVPILLQQKAIGAINIYAAEPNAFDTDIIKLFEKLSADMTYGLMTLRTRVERQQAELQLRQSEERFRKMFEDGPIGMVISDYDNRLLKVNAAFCQMLGYTEAELLEMNVADLSHPEDMSRNLELRQQMLNGDIPFVQMEKRYLSKDGQIVWGNLAVSVFKTGDIFYHLGKVEDITERKLAEEQLHKLSTAIEQSPSIVVITDIQARIEYVNPKFCQITGYTLEEAIGQTPSRLLKSGQQSSAFYQNLWQTILSGNDWRSELKNKKKNGTLYWELASISPVKNQGKAITHFIKVAEDITERKQAEDQLRASEKRFRKIFEEAPLGMVIVGYYLKIIQVNKAFYQMLGYSEPEPLIGATITDISAPEDIPKTKEMMKQLYRGEISSFRMEKRYRQQDGTLVWGNTSMSFFYDKKGQPLYFLAMIENITERKQAEQALRKSESMLARAQEIAHLGNWEWNIKTNQQIWSDENYRLFGYQPGAIEASFEHFMNLVHPEDRAEVAAIGQALLEGQPPPNYYESRIIRTDGTERILQSQMLCDFDETRRPIRITGVSIDVTERKRAEQQLKTLTERLSSIVDSLPVVPYTCQTEGVFATTYVGKNVTAVSGYQPKEFTSNPSFWAEHIHPDDRERVFKNIPKLLEHGYYEHEYRFKVADGRYKWFGDTVRVINNAEGVMTHIAGVWQNITERKQAEESLRESETRIRTLVENMVDGVVSIDENGIIESFNPAATTIFGYSAEEVIGKNVKILMPEPYRHEHDGYLEHYKSTGIAKIIGKGREVKGQHQNGSTFPLDLAVSEMWIGEQRKFVGIVRNITERKQFEEALKKAIESAEAANRAKSEFLANMSHEIRTPMNAVIGFSELLSTMMLDNQQKSYLDSIQTAGKSLLTLINDILDLSKIEAGRLDIQYEVVNPLLIFNELQQIFAIKIAEKNLEFIVDIDKQLPPALSLDEVRLRQVLLNLIGNAIKFTDKGYIKLTAKMSPSRTFSKKATSAAQNIMEGTAKPIQNHLLTEKVGDLILTVEDTGIGVPENQQAMIFESFRQQEGQSTRKYGGTGLGLAITKRLVEMMNGQISVKSSAGQGSVFEIILREIQVSSTESVQTDLESFDFKNISFKKAQVLVVDDIESNRTLINEYLSKVNLDVVEAADGQKGLLFAQEYQPNLILMDIRMPEMDGYEATRQLKENPTTQKIPVIALTASVTVDEKANVMAHGFDGYLSKPVSTHALFNELTHYLKHTKKPTKPPAAMADEPSLLLETWIELPVLLQTLEEKILPEWQEIIDMIETDAVEEFAKQLINLGNKHHASILIDYATKLRDKAQEFDIDGVERTLEEFPAILDRIKT